MQKALEQVLGRKVRIVLTFTEGGNGGEAAAVRPAAGSALDAASQRALEHPVVRKFQELFPQSQVREVRNLREDRE